MIYCDPKRGVSWRLIRWGGHPMGGIPIWNRGESAGPGLREVELGMPREFLDEQLKLGQGCVLQIDRYDIRIYKTYKVIQYDTINIQVNSFQL